MFGLDKVGKKMEYKSVEFKVMNHESYDTKLLKRRAREAAKEIYGDSEWTPDLHFNSQDSFFTKDGEEWTRTIVRRWV